ncbi:EamA family transporter [Cellulomonas sp. WB94]|uniref:EamA family transporter n=1 Tax=Cellulomonas sp. WB94 TaxID=2173174 RepID=UPI000D57C1F5|nr:EamA family transporter [Cellulomonas sp. WB94]PVU82699.1 EamA family transporter [Cellulomonas sp. WB94]
MLSKYPALLIGTAAAPALWGSTYLATTTLLPADRPLLAATLRALPAGVLLLLMCRRLPHGIWWWRSWVLGTLNIAAFFALLFVAAYRLPGGVAAMVGAIQPLLVALLAHRVLGERVTTRAVFSAVAGLAGVALIVLRAQARLDALGLVAAVGGALSMGTGIVLAKKWGQPAPPLTTTSWQLVAGGLTLVPLLLTIEGLPPELLTARNLAGYAYLSLLGTAFAYVMWFRGIARLPTRIPSFLGLLSPVVAILLGWLLAGQAMAAAQVAGVAIVLTSILTAVIPCRARAAAAHDERPSRPVLAWVGSGHDARDQRRPARLR